MNTERRCIDPVDAEDLAGDVDRQNLSEISDTSLRLRFISELDALAAKGIDVKNIVEIIYPTPNHAFSEEAKHILEGDKHYGQEGVTTEASDEELTTLDPDQKPLIIARSFGGKYDSDHRALGRRKTRNIGNRLLHER